MSKHCKISIVLCFLFLSMSFTYGLNMENDKDANKSKEIYDYQMDDNAQVHMNVSRFIEFEKNNDGTDEEDLSYLKKNFKIKISEEMIKNFDWIYKGYDEISLYKYNFSLDDEAYIIGESNQYNFIVVNENKLSETNIDAKKFIKLLYFENENPDISFLNVYVGMEKKDAEKILKSHYSTYVDCQGEQVANSYDIDGHKLELVYAYEKHNNGKSFDEGATYKAVVSKMIYSDEGF